MAEPDPPHGVPACVELRRRAFGQVHGMLPLRIRHAGRLLEWEVVRVLQEWGRPELAAGEHDLDDPAVIAWYRLQVYGPLPGQPGERDYFVMEIRAYGNKPGWFVTVGE
jgi:hypothetical protein